MGARLKSPHTCNYLGKITQGPPCAFVLLCGNNYSDEDARNQLEEIQVQMLESGFGSLLSLNVCSLDRHLLQHTSLKKNTWSIKVSTACWETSSLYLSLSLSLSRLLNDSSLSIIPLAGSLFFQQPRRICVLLSI